MLRSAGFSIEARPEEEVYVCRWALRPTDAGAVYPAKAKPNGGDREAAGR